MTRETQRQLYEALRTHTSGLEITRGAASGLDLVVLDRRIEAVRLLLEWLSQALEPQPPVFPAARSSKNSPPAISDSDISISYS
jgi:hypothetical protein